MNLPVSAMDFKNLIASISSQDPCTVLILHSRNTHKNQVGKVLAPIQPHTYSVTLGKPPPLLETSVFYPNF